MLYSKLPIVFGPQTRRCWPADGSGHYGYYWPGVRLHAGRQAEVLNQLILELPPQHPVSHATRPLTLHGAHFTSPKT